MAGKRIDITGKKFGRLTVIKFAGMKDASNENQIKKTA